HRVDRVLQLEDLPFDLDGDLLRKVARCHRGRHVRDVAHLRGEIPRHVVDRVGQVLPGARDALYFRLSTETSLRTDFARHPRHFAGEPTELIYHRVDRVLQLENLAANFDGDLLRQIAHRHGGGHLRDIPNLPGEIGGHRIHRVSQVLPRAGHAADFRLSTQT